MTKYKVVDNFLPTSSFKEILNITLDGNTDWHLANNVSGVGTEETPDFYFVHKLYEARSPISRLYDLVDENLLSQLDIKALLRVKLNLYPNIGQRYYSERHIDYEFEHTGAIFYLNTCNGPTVLEDGTEIDAVANRILFFDASKPHNSVHATDAKQRFNININYL